MTQVFREDGVVVPVTRVQAGPCVVTQVKKGESVQIGFDTQKTFRLNKAMKGHLKDITMKGQKNMSPRVLKEFRVVSDMERGDIVTVANFNAGEKVMVTGTSKGKGFQGVVKRHGFAGSPASHGHKDQLRMPGSIGATGPQRVFKGTRMGGHMGNAQISVKNLEIVDVLEECNELLIKGAVPGARNSIVIITTDEGEMKKAQEIVSETIETSVGVTEEHPVSSDTEEQAVTEEVKEQNEEHVTEKTETIAEQADSNSVEETH